MQTPMQAGPPPGMGMPVGGYGRPGDAASLPPSSVAGVPPKSNALLFVGLALGAMALIGLGGIAFYMRSAKKDDPLHGAGSASALPSISVAIPALSSAPPVVASTPPPPEPPPTAETTATADAEPPPPEPTATATADNKPPPPEPTAAPAPGPGPTAHANPTPGPAALPAAPATTKDAGPALDPNAFNEPLARQRLSQANSVLVFCNTKGTTGPGAANITFNTDGTVSAVALDPPYAGTPAGECVSGQFKRQKVTPFQGSPKTIKHTFDVPK
jgi:hypothetical protein